MQNYAENPASCRVDFFKPSNKWYTTEAVIFPSDTWKEGNPKDGTWVHPVDKFKRILCEHLKGRLKGMWAVCLEPYFEHSWPLMVKLDD